MFNALFPTNTVKDRLKGAFIRFSVTELNAIIGQYRMNTVRDCRNQALQKIRGGEFSRAVMALYAGKLSGSVDADEKRQFAFS